MRRSRWLRVPGWPGRPPAVSRERFEAAADERLHQWAELDPDERARLTQRGFQLLAKRWEAARGFDLDETMRITIAANAALLAIGRDDDLYRNVTAIVVHRRPMLLQGERRGPSRGVVTRGPWPVHGHTSAYGPVFVAWSEVTRQWRNPEGASNVVLHEFAHKIDALTGMLDGTPPLEEAAELERWVQVCTAELEAVRRADGSSPLRSYAGVNPAEFFAVATESFFEQPCDLRRLRPALYEVLRAFYRQDPAERAARASSGRLA